MEALPKNGVTALLAGIIQTKMSLAVAYASRASIYDAKLTIYELSTPQCIVLALLYALVNNDITICSILGPISSNIPHLRSSYLKVWLIEDFQFDQMEMYRAFSTAARYFHSGLIDVPSHVLQIICSIVCKYNIVKQCKEHGDKETLEFLESLGVDIGGKSSMKMKEPEDESPPAIETAEVVRIENTDSDQPVEVEITQEDDTTQAGPSGTAAEFPSPDEEEYEEYCHGSYYDCDYGDDDDYYDDDDDDEVYIVESSDSDSNENTIEERINMQVEAFDIMINHAQSFLDPSVPAFTTENRNTLLHKAAEKGNVASIKALIGMGVEIDCVDLWHRTPAFVAATEGKLSALKVLYHQGNADLEHKDNRGDSLLHSAADGGHTRVIRWLLRRGLCVNVSGRGGWQPLHRASQKGHLETVRLLLDFGACPNVKASVGGTSLHRAVCWNKLEVAHLLIARGALINATDNRADTPLSIAAKFGNLPMVQLLLDCGADPSIKGNRNRTPYRWAERNGHTEVVDYMASIGATY